jgi:hypothetical protein
MTDPRLASPSWPERWAACKGTSSEDECLRSISADTQHFRNGLEVDAHVYATVALTCPDERDDMIAAMEDVFLDWEADEAHADAAYTYELRTGKSFETSTELSDEQAWRDDYKRRKNGG